MNLTAYQIALIGGAFTILGALIGTLAGYWLARLLAERNSFIAARAKLRAAFAPALGQIYLAQKHGDHDRPSIEDFVKNNLLAHASAIEEFRPFVASSKSAAYQGAWEDYRKHAHDPHAATAEDWMTDLSGGSALEKRIYAILLFTKT